MFTDFDADETPCKKLNLLGSQTLSHSNVIASQEDHTVDFGAGVVKFILDSGAQISVVKPKMIPQEHILLDSSPTVSRGDLFYHKEPVVKQLKPNL